VEELLFAKHINCAFVKLVAQPQFIVGLIKIKLYFLFNQIAISVVVVNSIKVDRGVHLENFSLVFLPDLFFLAKFFLLNNA
jgi:hypothetical protein